MRQRSNITSWIARFTLISSQKPTHRFKRPSIGEPPTKRCVSVKFYCRSPCIPGKHCKEDKLIHLTLRCCLALMTGFFPEPNVTIPPEMTITSASEALHLLLVRSRGVVALLSKPPWTVCYRRNKRHIIFWLQPVVVGGSPRNISGHKGEKKILNNSLPSVSWEPFLLPSSFSFHQPNHLWDH